MSVRRKTHVLPLDSELDQTGEPFVAPPLPYEYDALAPVISADTLRVHHLKHHQGYADKLNELLVKHTGQSMDRIKSDTERDYFMSAIESKEYGIIDEVLVQKPTGPTK